MPCKLPVTYFHESPTKRTNPTSYPHRNHVNRGFAHPSTPSSRWFSCSLINSSSLINFGHFGLSHSPRIKQTPIPANPIPAAQPIKRHLALSSTDMTLISSLRFLVPLPDPPLKQFLRAEQGRWVIHSRLTRVPIRPRTLVLIMRAHNLAALTLVIFPALINRNPVVKP